MRDTKEKLSMTSVALHWIVGLTILTLIPVGVYMTDYEVYELYPLHKSIGMLIFLVILFRVVWRMINGWPESAANYKAWEMNLARFVQWVLIIGTVLIPISGMVMSAMGGYGLHIFGVELLASNPSPDNPYKMIPLNGPIAGFAHEAHSLLGKVIFVAVVLHIAGALKHHFIDKDFTLRRMLGLKKK